MSISALTDDLVRKRNHEAAQYADLGEVGKDVEQTPTTNIVGLIAKQVPAEILTLYVAFQTPIQDPNTKGSEAEWVLFFIFLVLTPIMTWLLFAIKERANGRPLPKVPEKWPIWPMIASTIAYIAWAFALPATPFDQFTFYSPAFAGAIALGASTVLGLIDNLVQPGNSNK